MNTGVNLRDVWFYRDSKKREIVLVIQVGLPGGLGGMAVPVWASKIPHAPMTFQQRGVGSGWLLFAANASWGKRLRGCFRRGLSLSCRPCSCDPP